ncbi:T9SS-dependent choice-of-anchor J family protein [Tunicatimonas pelagia]|uniref:T9SS-dependent choice-of-anchor J family protein n=1 Tax=Tunicatimonas pelagia TaxID=931531 RepID=UPI002666B3CE|nr:choice-of-anchor J domain-containing protein [Tunicatimonas pelagia]WKN42016.1 choice-of-anchor J domain-containing protein [Tunicatimonas pelagia]
MNRIGLRLSWLGIALLCITTQLQAQQEKCGTVLLNQGKNKEQFEQWINNMQLKRQISPQAKLQSEDAEPVYRIPVVVHVIHRGEPEGTGSNIPFEQIEDQIRILNEDFRRLNADTTETPSEFLPFAADARIEFVLARQSPEGFATNGVVRVEGSRDDYGLRDGAILSDSSLWDPELYMNIWVAPLRNNLLGYAQFPDSELPGLNGASTNPNTDGIVIDFNFFGSVGNVVDRSLGRTTTHEVGHYFGLRHIWGDGDCSADDFVADTPLQESESDGCPAHPQTSCGSVDMFQNYMDYTTDRCMNLFTLGQKERMRIVLENSPRRRTLLTSPGLVEPIVLDDDAGISTIVSPQRSECSGDIIPSITVTNTGREALTSFTVALNVQGNFREETTFNINLEAGESTTVSLSPVSLEGNTSNTEYNFTFFITEANGATDENATNNVRSVSFIIPQRAALPLVDNFEQPSENSLLDLGYISNADNNITWSVTSAPGFSGENNEALWLDYFDYQSNIGTQDILYTPVFSLANLRDASLSLRYAHAPFRDGDGSLSNDGFAIAISTNCGATFDTFLFEAFGEDLATAEPTGSEFIPSSRVDWRQLTFPLDAYAGNENLQVAFIGYNDFGNNLYIDDISIQANQIREVDLAISDIIAPAYLSGQTNPTPRVVVKNIGSSPVQSFDVAYQFDNQTPTEFSYAAFVLEPGEETILELESPTLALGIHNFSIRVINPNLRVDDVPDNNYRQINFVVDDKQDIIPLINEFQEYSVPDVLQGESVAAAEAWQVVNPDSSITWETVEAAGNGFNNEAVRIQNNQYTEIGAVDRLVSPVLDFSNTSEASLIFQVSYAQFSENYVDTLNILVSTDDGETYERVLGLEGTTLSAGVTTDAEWLPVQESDWHEMFVDLSRFAGETEIRVAFESINGYGNNIFLDDVEFFLSGDDDPVRTVENSYKLFPNPTSDILNSVFNLRSRETIQAVIYNSQGQTVWQRSYPNTLNQTFDVDLSTFPRGVYIFRVFSSTLTDSKQFILQ